MSEELDLLMQIGATCSILPTGRLSNDSLGQSFLLTPF